MNSIRAAGLTPVVSPGPINLQDTGHIKFQFGRHPHICSCIEYPDGEIFFLNFQRAMEESTEFQKKAGKIIASGLKNRQSIFIDCGAIEYSNIKHVTQLQNTGHLPEGILDLTLSAAYDLITSNAFKNSIINSSRNQINPKFLITINNHPLTQEKHLFIAIKHAEEAIETISFSHPSEFSLGNNPNGGLLEPTCFAPNDAEVVPIENISHETLSSNSEKENTILTFRRNHDSLQFHWQSFNTIHVVSNIKDLDIAQDLIHDIPFIIRNPTMKFFSLIQDSFTEEIASEHLFSIVATDHDNYTFSVENIYSLKNHDLQFLILAALTSNKNITLKINSNSGYSQDSTPQIDDFFDTLGNHSKLLNIEYELGERLNVSEDLGNVFIYNLHRANAKQQHY